MILRNERCQNWKLYAITSPPKKGGLAILQDRVYKAIKGGADVVQFRDKQSSEDELIMQAKALLSVTRGMGVPLIINDSVRVAKAVGADGLHLGQLDGSFEHARQMLGPDAILGRSTHSLEQAIYAEVEGFDYIGVGPVFETPTKLDRIPVGVELVTQVSSNVTLPFVAIGGIDESNVEAVCKAGARCVAAVRALMDAVDPESSAKKLKEVVTKFR